MTGRDLLAVARRRWYLVAGWFVVSAVLAATISYDIWAAAWLIPCLAVLTVPLAQRLDLGPGRPSGATIVAAGFGVKVVVGTITRYVMVYEWYDGDSDAERYHRVGSELARGFRDLDLGGLGSLVGSGFVDALTGGVYALTGPTRLGGFVVFSWLAFVGMWCCVRALQVARPGCDARRYAILLFAWPSMWFWPSSLGKDAPMIAAFGLTLLGLAKVFDGQRTGPLVAVAGAVGVTLVRPHMTFLIAAAALTGLIVYALAPGRPGPGDAPLPGRPYRATLILLLLVGVGIAVPVAADRFDRDGFGWSSAREFLDETAFRTNAGDSRFDAPDPETPLGYPAAAVTVLFRPFVTEASNVQELVAALEGVLLLVVLVARRRAVVDALRRSIREPFLTFCVAYTAVFFFTFGRFESFALLSRQRTQLIPILLVFVVAARAAAPPGRRPKVSEAGV